MLHICKASAGSGKTHKLTGAYIKLLFAHPRLDSNYRHILAVTFTNKATEEMKDRILKELNILAHTPEQSDYMPLLIGQYSYSPIEIQERALRILKKMLHDYSYFNISTIDKFFQQTIRSFAREIGLMGGYNVEMNNEDVLSQSIDMMLSELNEKDNPTLVNWLTLFSESNIEQGNSWDIRGKIVQLAKELFSESYQALRQRFPRQDQSKESLSAYHKQLQKEITGYKKQLQQIAIDALGLLREVSLQPSDFSGGSRSACKLFTQWSQGGVKQPTATFYDWVDQPDKWLTKKADSRVRSAVQVIERRFNTILHQISDYFATTYIDLQSALEVDRFFYTLAILHDIEHYIAQYSKHNNLLLLSQSNQLLSAIIGQDCDTPFIYEKTGVHIHHYMIDEFQDTSQLQWHNFYPLIRESQSNNRDSLIVGDAKQSIYRFRNSDSGILTRQLQQQFYATQLEIQSLLTNYRSRPAIISFNNQLFGTLIRLAQSEFNTHLEDIPLSSETQELRQRLIDTYRDVVQEVPSNSKEGGYVRVEFIEEPDSENSKDWKQVAKQKLIESIEQLQANGYRAQDIAILTRRKSESAAIAQALMQARLQAQETGNKTNYDFLSNDSLKIGDNHQVQLIVHILNWFQNQQQILTRAIACYEIERYHHPDQDNTLTQSLESTLSLDRLQELWSQVGHLPLYEMCEGIIRHLHLERATHSTIYLHAFMDCIIDFSAHHAPSLDNFLRWWKENKSSKTISSPEQKDAIQIITIHSSKGLAFKVVIIPYADWGLDHGANHQNILWSPHQQSAVPIVPIRYGSNLLYTHFRDQYLSEKMDALLDNLNLTYVAFTRAREELIIMAPLKAKHNTIADLIMCSLQGNHDSAELLADYDATNHLFERGCHIQCPPKQDRNDTTALSLDTYRSYELEDRLQLKLRGALLVQEKGSREYGQLMHEILSSIKTASDIDIALDRYSRQGEINVEEQKEIRDKLQIIIKGRYTQEWFSDQALIWNERDILAPNGSKCRPDRVVQLGDTIHVIDYKFGQHKTPQHQVQVLGYMSAIRQMGYHHTVKGYIWYILHDEVVALD